MQVTWQARDDSGPCNHITGDYFFFSFLRVLLFYSNAQTLFFLFFIILSTPSPPLVFFLRLTSEKTFKIRFVHLGGGLFTLG